MHSLPLLDSDALKHLADRGVVVADEDAMAQAVHDVYCGPDADHDHPNDKDRQQAKSLLQSLQEALAAMYPA